MSIGQWQLKKGKLLKMCGKFCKGDVYSFYLPEKANLGAGGNGKVYEVKLIGDNSGTTYAVKTFSCYGNISAENKKLRYERFCQEADFLEKVGNQIEGIIHIYDKHLPADYSGDEEAWYLMPKAYSYNVCKAKPLDIKLQDMIYLANTLKILHEKKYAHRDIKPNNLLWYSKKLCLCDFGLLWGYCEDRLTFATGRIGPINILPPELDPVIPELDINYTLSDVYLFAKILWMVIKENEYGFMGPYLRNRELIYLDPREFNITTFEPIHQLLEKATDDDINKRIDIKECINLIEEQMGVLSHGQSFDTWHMKIQNYKYMENTKRITMNNTPKEQKYEDDETIFEMLNSIIGNSIFFLNDRGLEREILISYCEKIDHKRYRLYSMIDGHIQKEYRLEVNYLIYNTYEKTIQLYMNNYEKDEDGKDEKEKNNNVEYLSKNHTLIIRSPMRDIPPQ